MKQYSLDTNTINRLLKTFEYPVYKDFLKNNRFNSLFKYYLYGSSFPEYDMHTLLSFFYECLDINVFEEGEPVTFLDDYAITPFSRAPLLKSKSEGLVLDIPENVKKICSDAIVLPGVDLNFILFPSSLDYIDKNAFYIFSRGIKEIYCYRNNIDLVTNYFKKEVPSLVDKIKIY